MSQQSVALQIFPQVSMGTAQTRMPVLSVLPMVNWGTSDTSSYQTSEANWSNKYLDVAELYAIVPVPNKVIRDNSIDIWEQVKNPLMAKMAVAIDAAIFLNQNFPAQWTNTTAIGAESVTRNNKYTRGTNAAAAGGIAEDINQLMLKVEEDGFQANFFAGSPTFKSKIRSARDTTGQKLLDLQRTADGGQSFSIDGTPIYFAIDGAWGTGTGAYELITGDRNQGIIGLRQDIEISFLKETTFFDVDGKPTLNLGQQDMTALKLTFRVAYQTANIPTLMNENNSTRYPFAVLQAP
jgi:HK97 family phage major capsid protein